MRLAVPSSADARLVVAVTGLFCMFAAPAEPRWVVPPALAAVTVASVWFVLRARTPAATTWVPRTDDTVRRRLLRMIVVVACMLGGLQTGSVLGVGVAADVGIAVLYAVLAVRATGGTAPRRAAFWCLAALHAALVSVAIVTVAVRIDVAEFVNGGIAAILDGTSPYAITVRDVYSPTESAQYYGPGVVVDGRVIYGYPYLPSTLLLDLPGRILGDVRFIHLAAVLATAAIAWRSATDRIGRMMAVALVAAPTSSIVVLGYWVEPLMSLLLVLAALALMRGSRWVAPVVGLLFASKQYLVVALPALWVVARSAGRRRAIEAIVGAALLIGGFLLWDPTAFVRSAVLLQFRQPFREDAVSLLPMIADLAEPLPSWVLGVVPALVGAWVSVLLARRLRPGGTAFLLAAVLPVLCTVLLSKQAFSNYYWFVGTGLLVAAILWPVDDPVAGRDRSAGHEDRPGTPGGGRDTVPTSRTVPE